MSAATLLAFFPDAVRVVDAWAPGLLPALFPPECVDVELAPTTITHVLLRCPLLLPIAALGIALGARGARRLAGLSSPALSAAMVCYALMNAAAAAAHCVAPLNSPAHGVWGALDVASTCTTSALLLAVSLLDGGAARLPRWAPASLLALAAAASYAAALPWTNEVLYLGVTLGAAGAIWLRELLRLRHAADRDNGGGGGHLSAAAADAARPWLAAAVAAVAAAASSPLCERALCVRTGGAVTALHVLFLATHAAMLCLERYFLIVLSPSRKKRVL